MSAVPEVHSTYVSDPVTHARCYIRMFRASNTLIGHNERHNGVGVAFLQATAANGCQFIDRSSRNSIGTNTSESIGFLMR